VNRVQGTGRTLRTLVSRPLRGWGGEGGRASIKWLMGELMEGGAKNIKNYAAVRRGGGSKRDPLPPQRSRVRKEDPRRGQLNGTYL